MNFWTAYQSDEVAPRNKGVIHEIYNYSAIGMGERRIQIEIAPLVDGAVDTVEKILKQAINSIDSALPPRALGRGDDVISAVRSTSNIYRDCEHICIIPSFEAGRGKDLGEPTEFPNLKDAHDLDVMRIGIGFANLYRRGFVSREVLQAAGLTGLPGISRALKEAQRKGKEPQLVGVEQSVSRGASRG